MIVLFLSLSLMLPFSGGCNTTPLADKGSFSSIGAITNTGRMSKGRAAHTATLLGTGKVLIVGGFGGGENGMTTAEIYDPASGTFMPTSSLAKARASHTATRLPSGKVLIAGGFDGNYIDSAELYDPATGRFSPAGRMTQPRSEHTAVLLADGRVLIVGGVGTGWTFLAEAEIYDPASNSFTKTGSMAVPRESHTATLLGDGRVLITGGHRGRRAAINIYSSTEIYDPRSQAFSSAADLTIRRHKHDAALLDDGRVLIVGGSDERDSRGAYTSVEIYDPKTNRTRRVGDMNASRYKLQGTTVKLPNGKILIAGGGQGAEVFDPAAGAFIVTGGDYGSSRHFSTATLLPGGNVLITGGYDDRLQVSQDAWIYR